MKKAILVGFAIQTRLIIDTDDLDSTMNSVAGVDAICKAAREKIGKEPENYLCGDNCDILEEDIEVPAQEKDKPDLKFTTE